MEHSKSKIHAEVIKRAQDGDQSAYYRLYKLYVQAIYNTCIRMVINQLDAEDLVQETFINAFKNLKSYRAEASFGSWLKKIAINKSLNFLRKRKHIYKKLEDTDIMAGLADESVSEQDNVFALPPEKVHQYIKELPGKARVIFNLYLLEDYKHNEIAEMLDISVSTSKSQYLRAKALLKEMLLKEISYEN